MRTYFLLLFLLQSLLLFAGKNANGYIDYIFISNDSLSLYQREDNTVDEANFAIDDSLLLDVYPEAGIKPLGPPPVSSMQYQHSLKLYYTPRTSTTPDYLIVTTEALYDSLSIDLQRYAEDVHAIYGYGIYIESTTNATPTNIRNLIISYQNNLAGVFLIGNIGECMYEIDDDYSWKESSYGYRKWPCDLYFMDINGTWVDTDNNGILDSHTGDVQPDIFLGRLSAHGLSSLGSEVALIRQQLNKSHQFWWKSSFHVAQTSLNYIYKDWVQNRFYQQYIANVFTSGLVDDIRDVSGSNFSKTDYLFRLTQPIYGFTHLAAHSSPTTHNLYSAGGRISLSEIKQSVLNNNCYGYNLFCCSGCNWLAAGYQGYLGGVYLFNQGKTLAIVGSTKTGGMLSSNSFYSNLATKSVGNAFRDWWRTVIGNSYSDYVVSWYYGMTLLGDPTINFRHQVSDVCVEDLTLTSFPPNDSSNLILFKAGNSITISNSFVIPSGVHVIFDAPNVIFANGFTCPEGASFETRNEGCEL